MRRALLLRLGVLSLLSVGLCWPRGVRAEPPRGTSDARPTQPAPDAANPAPPGITMPVLKRNEGADYPKQAVVDGVRETVKVVLVLEIDATGLVKRATVESARGHGFDEAAVAAGSKLVFEPARKGATPIAVRIRFTYTFPPPTASFVGRVLAQRSAAPIGGAQVTARAADGKDYTTTTDANGRWSLAQLPFGKYRLTVAAPRFTAESSEQDVNPGEELSLTDRLTAVVDPVVAPPLDAGAPVPPPIEPVEEVQVRGARPPREVTRRTLEQRELTRIPGTNGDALRSLQNLPGVARPPGLLGLLVVRGSGPQDTNVFVDGTLIPLVYHFGGLSSVVPSEILEKIDFYPGNFSAEYGRAMGGIVDAGVRDPKKDRLHGMAQVDLIDARVLAEGPLGKGWTFTLAGRRSYVDLWLKPVLEKAGAGVSTAPVYYDYQAIVQKDFDKRQSLRFFFFGSDDKIEILVKSVNGSDPSLAGGISAHTGFWRFQGRYLNKISDATQFRLTSAVGQDFIDFALGDNFFRVNSWPITTRAEISHKIAKSARANVGLDVLYVPYDVSVRAPSPGRPGEPPSGPFLSRPPLETKDSDAIVRPGMYADLELTPWRGARLVPGMRLDYSKEIQAWDLAPRFVGRQDLTTEFPRTTLKGGVGLYYQPPQPQETNVVFGRTGLRSNRATHYGFGVEQEFTKHLELSFEGFYKQLDYLVTPRAGNVGTGRAYGLETLIRYKPDERFFGWLAYTLSRSERRDSPGEPIRLSTFDQTHILTVLGSYRLGRGWELGARFRLVSGNTYTPNTYGFYDENSGSYLPFLQYPPNGARLPLFHQLDVRVDKTWQLGNSGKISVYLDIQNTYNQGNVEGISYNFNSTQHTFATGLPILPSLGIRGEL